MHDPEPLVFRRQVRPVGQGVAVFMQFTGMQNPLEKRRDVVCVSWTVFWQKYPSAVRQSEFCWHPM